MTFLATCSDCDKRFRVPHANKAWSCKVCDGVLVLGDEEPAKESSESKDLAPGECSECGARNGRAANFCDDCGAALSAGSEGANEQTAKREKREKQEAAGEMRKANKMIGAMKLWLKVCLGFEALGLLFRLFATSHALSPSGPPMFETLVGLAVATFSVGLIATVIYQLSKRPFPAALALSVIATLNLALALVSLAETGKSGLPLIIGGVIGGIPAAIYWLVTYQAARLTRLMREHPDLFLSRRMRGEQSSGVGSARMRSEARQRQEAKPPFVLLGMLGTVILVVIVAAWINRPASPDVTLQAMVVAWDKGDVEGLADFVQPSGRDRWVRSMRRYEERNGWAAGWPQVSEYAWERNSRSDLLSAEFRTEAGPVPIKLRWESELGWVMRSMAFTEIRDWEPK
ncbi:MAG: RNase P subunit RPR2 [Planctomycetota bacterium]|jgi:RNase P subunit RPR2